MNNNKKILKQSLLISCALLLSIQSIAAVCTYKTQDAAKVAADDIEKAAETAAKAAETAAKAAEELADEICTKAAAILAADSDVGLRAAVAAGAVITIGGIVVVAANSGSSAAASPTASTIDTFNAIDQYYVYHPVAPDEQTGDEEQNIVGLDNLSYLRDVLHASDNVEHMGEHTNEAHSLEERGHLFKEAAFVNKDGKTTYNMTFIDAIGMNTITPQKTYLNSNVKISGLYLQNTDLDVRASNTLTADALSMKKGTLAVNGTVTVGAFLLDTDSTLTGGDNIAFNASSNKLIIDKMKEQVPDRYKEVDYGKFDLRGTVDKFTAKKGMNVYLAPSSAANGTLTHSGGTVVLAASTPIRVKNYTVTEASVLSVNWDNVDQTNPLMTVTGTSDIGNNLLGVQIKTISTTTLAVGKKLTILSATTLTGTRATYTQDLAGGKFEFKLDNKALTVTCTKATTSVAGTTGLSASLSADILGKSDGDVKGHFAALEIPTAMAALDAAVSDHYLSDAPAPMSYFSIHQQAYTAGGWNNVDESSDATLTSMGVNTGAAKLGFSVSTPSVQTQSATPTVGAHLLSKDLFMDAFYTAGQNGVGSTLGWQHDGFHVGVSYMYDQRHGVSETNPMGRIEATNVNQHRIVFNAGLNKRVETIDLSATVFAEALRAAHDYDVSINDEKFHINGHSFDRHCGLQLQAKANLDTGYISAAFGLSGSTHSIEPTTSVNFSLAY
ncbi:hypothetical protein [Candidatus Bodocaedibacter vickermanii]|uniref:Autotransporter domain-containing protein n=1 Tax=Candidatus Bodocaedibacter vickermanii TaxID=2741701 RepID=A0A7L9RSG8_9PROT|nr:hypothetical protein CPBP_00247 [Candidatus Paracaedibacteraceae bacterium 'Lake Konstanz']